MTENIKNEYFGFQSEKEKECDATKFVNLCQGVLNDKNLNKENIIRKGIVNIYWFIDQVSEVRPNINYQEDSKKNKVRVIQLAQKYVNQESQ